MGGDGENLWDWYVAVLWRRFELEVDLHNPLRRLNSIHDRHLQVHQDEVEVLSTALFLDVLCVLLKALQSIDTAFDVDVQQVFELHLERDHIIALVIDDQATFFASALRPIVF